MHVKKRYDKDILGLFIGYLINPLTANFFNLNFHPQL